MESSPPTHSHTLARCKGAVLQTIAVATAVSKSEFKSAEFINPLRTALTYFTDLLHDTSPFIRPRRHRTRPRTRTSCNEMSEILGTGITGHEPFRWPSIVSCDTPTPTPTLSTKPSS